MKALKDWRQEQGYRQIDVARKLGMSKSMVHMIETGRRSISPKMLTKIARVTGLSPEVLRPDLAKHFS